MIRRRGFVLFELGFSLHCLKYLPSTNKLLFKVVSSTENGLHCVEGALWLPLVHFCDGDGGHIMVIGNGLTQVLFFLIYMQLFIHFESDIATCNEIYL